MGDPLRYPVAGIPSCYTHILLGNYPKTPLKFKRGLISMCERDVETPNRGSHFLNPSIELFKQILRGYVDAADCLPYDALSEEDLCVCMMKLFVMMDDFPFNLPYETNVPAIKARLSPASMDMLEQFHFLVEKCVIEVIQAQNSSRNLTQLPILTLGTVPQNAWKKRKDSELSSFARSARIPHPCTLLHRSSDCSESAHSFVHRGRFLEGDASLGSILASAFGNGASSSFFEAFYNRNSTAVERVLAVRRTYGFGGVHEC